MIPKLKADLPPDVNIEIANDNSVFIDRSVKNVYRTIAEADPAGGAGDLRLPAHGARLDHPDRDHPGQPDRHLRA